MKYLPKYFRTIFTSYANIGVGITKNFSSLIIAQGIYKVLAFLTFIFIARYLGAEAFGRISYVLSLVTFFMFATDFGISGLLVKEAAGESQERRAEYINNVATLKFFLSLISYITILLLILILKETRKLLILVAMFGLTMILDSYTIFLKSIFQIFERMEYEAMSLIFEGIFKIGLILLVIRYASLNIFRVSQIFLLVSILTLIFILFTTRKKFISLKPGFDFKLWKRLFRAGIPFTFLMFFQVINFKIDIIMLSKMANNIITGWFSVATRLIEPILIIPVTFTVAVFPVASRLSKNQQESLPSMFKSSLIVLILISVLISISLYLGANFYIPLLFGTEFLKSIVAIRLLGFALIPIFLKFFLDSFSLALNKSNIIFFNYIVGTLVNVFINLILIPKINLLGTCVATLLSESIIVGFYLLWFKRNLQKEIKIKNEEKKYLFSFSA